MKQLLHMQTKDTFLPFTGKTVDNKVFLFHSTCRVPTPFSKVKFKHFSGCIYMFFRHFAAMVNYIFIYTVLLCTLLGKHVRSSTIQAVLP